MDDNPTRILHPRELLRQLAESMNREHDELSVTIPAHSTWRSALQAVESALNGVDEPFLVFPPCNTNPRVMREWALQAASRFPLENVQALPIRSSVDLGTPEPPPPPNEERRERLRQMAKEISNTEFRYPYVSLRPALEDSFLPMIRGALTVRGVDGRPKDPSCKLSGINMIFYTGVHMTIITEELLCPSFREYLKDSVHDPYRGKDGLSVHINAGIALSNCPVLIDFVAAVFPKSKMPNQLVGILFGQSGCIDRLSFRSIPRHVLRAKGEEISDGLWGDIVLDEYVNMDGEVTSI